MAKRQQFSCALKHHDIVAQVGKCGSTGFNVMKSFPVLYPSNIFAAVRPSTSTSRVPGIYFSGSCSQETSVWYHVIRDVVFVISWGTLLRPTAGAVVLMLKSTPLRNVPWLCASIQEESCAIFIAAFHRDICREHSLIGRRNYLMTEAANSHSAAAGPELSSTRNPIAYLASD